LRPSAERWLRQAEADLQAAHDSERAGHYEWACFQAQQCAEKALKSLLYAEGYTSVVTHSIVDLVGDASKLAPALEELMPLAKTLDNYYLPTRYPNALASSLSPSQYYQREDAQTCLSYAESILTAVKRYFAG